MFATTGAAVIAAGTASDVAISPAVGPSVPTTPLVKSATAPGSAADARVGTAADVTAGNAADAAVGIAAVPAPIAPVGTMLAIPGVAVFVRSGAAAPSAPAPLIRLDTAGTTNGAAIAPPTAMLAMFVQLTPWSHLPVLGFHCPRSRSSDCPGALRFASAHCIRRGSSP